MDQKAPQTFNLMRQRVEVECTCLNVMLVHESNNHGSMARITAFVQHNYSLQRIIFIKDKKISFIGFVANVSTKLLERKIQRFLVEV